MPSRNFPPDALEQARTVLAGCKQIDPTLKTGALTQEGLSTLIADTQATHNRITELELQLVDLRNQRDGRLTEVWEATKRARATVKGMYGDDSSEYEIVGGTRRSDRKKMVRRRSAA